MQCKMAVHFVHSPYTYEGMVPVLVPVLQPSASAENPSQTVLQPSIINRAPMVPACPAEHCECEHTDIPETAPRRTQRNRAAPFASSVAASALYPEPRQAFVVRAQPAALPLAPVATTLTCNSPQNCGQMPSQQRRESGPSVASPTRSARSHRAAASVLTVTTPLPTNTVATSTASGTPLSQGLSPAGDFSDVSEDCNLEVPEDIIDAEDAGRQSSSGALGCSASCAHTSAWKRLRGKRGFGYYSCRVCGAKWKTVSRGNSAGKAKMSLPPSSMPKSHSGFWCPDLS
eukprot:RCo003250